MNGGVDSTMRHIAIKFIQEKKLYETRHVELPRRYLFFEAKKLLSKKAAGKNVKSVKQAQMKNFAMFSLIKILSFVNNLGLEKDCGTEKSKFKSERDFFVIVVEKERKLRRRMKPPLCRTTKWRKTCF